MKRILILAALAILPVLACSQQRTVAPVTIEWNGESTLHEVGIQNVITDEIIVISETDLFEYTIDLESLGYNGEFAALVRGLTIYTDPELKIYSDWISSVNPGDVIMIDGEPQLFTMITGADKPYNVRRKE